MVDKIWLGGIYIRSEGGYTIVLKALNHYKKRLKTLGNSPELKESAAMFASVLNAQARKTVPQIDQTIKKIYDGLVHQNKINNLEQDISFLEKALTCYESDVCKAKETSHKYFIDLVGNMQQAEVDAQTAKSAIKNINMFSQ